MRRAKRKQKTEGVITVWITKFITCIGVLLGLIFTPMQYYFCGLDFSIGNFIVLLIMSIFIVMFFLILLIKTNDPLTRFNPLSINKKYQTTMTHSIDERPGQLFEFDQPTQEEIKQQNRVRKLKNEYEHWKNYGFQIIAEKIHDLGFIFNI